MKTGPGYVLIGPANPTEPAWVATANKFSNNVPGLYSVGYTAAGFVIAFGTLATDTLTPAEEYDPIKIITTSRSPNTISFDVFGVDEVLTKYAFNGGTWSTVGAGTGATLVRKYVPPDPGTETRCSLVFISADGDEAYWAPQCFQTGNATRTFTKGATAAGYTGLQFSTEKPASGPPINYYTASANFTGPTITA